MPTPLISPILLRAAALALALAACGGASESSSATTGTRVALHTRVVVDERAQEPFTTKLGWTVALRQAAVSIGALYYFDGEPAFARRTPTSTPLHERLVEWLGPRSAWAHPGHYQAGNALGQMLTPSSVDLLNGLATLADAEGVTGTFRSARLVFGDGLTGPAAATLAGHVAVAVGVATRSEHPGDEAKHFWLTASLAEIAKSAAGGAVDGCAFERASVEADGTVTLRVDPRAWFGLVDFTELAPGSDEAPTVVEPTAPARIGFALGVAQLSAYHFSYAKE